MDSSWQSVKPIEMPEEAIQQVIENEMSFTEKMQKFAKQSPFVIAGVIGLSTVCGIGAYKWKTRTVIPSIFLTQLRVIAQGTALAFITMGMGYNMYKDFVLKKRE